MHGARGPPAVKGPGKGRGHAEEAEGARSYARVSVPRRTHALVRSVSAPCLDRAVPGQSEPITFCRIRVHVPLRGGCGRRGLVTPDLDRTRTSSQRIPMS